jgi:hypothetical protein
MILYLQRGQKRKEKKLSKIEMLEKMTRAVTKKLEHSDEITEI